MADTHERPPGESAAGTGSNRRDFLKWFSRAFLGLWAVGGAGAIAAYLKAPERNEASSERTVRVGLLDEMAVGEARLVRHGVKPFYVVRTDARTVVAISAVCTHMRCVLNFDHQRRGLVCPCHDGRFDMNGNVVSGPPPRPLPTYEVSMRAGEVFVRV